MDFLTLKEIKQHCRIDCYADNKQKQKQINDAICKAEAKAEDKVYTKIGKGHYDIIREYGEVPIAIKYATLMATTAILYGRKPEEDYTFEILLKPYKKKEK